MEKRTLSDFGKGITINNRPATFRELLELIAGNGNGHLYEESDEYIEILTAALEAQEFDWLEVSNIVAPLVEHIMLDALQEDPEVYKELITNIRKSYRTLLHNELERNRQSDNEEFSVQERKLIRYVRNLQDSDIMAAITAIDSQVEHAKTQSIIRAYHSEPEKSKGWNEQAERLEELSRLLGLSNKEYCELVDAQPEDYDHE